MRPWLLLKNLTFALLVPGTTAGLVPYLILRRLGVAAWPALTPLAVVALGLGAAGMAISGHCLWAFGARGQGTPAPFDPPKTLVVQGLYRRNRNPMYIGVVGVLLAEALLFRSAVLLGYAAAVFAVFNLFVRLYEEPHLRRQFGAAYDEYCHAVPRWGWARRPFGGSQE